MGVAVDSSMRVWTLERGELCNQGEGRRAALFALKRVIASGGTSMTMSEDQELGLGWVRSSKGILKWIRS